MSRFLFFVSLTFFLTGCQTYSSEEKAAFDKEIISYLKKEGIECEKSKSGLYYKITEPGEGRSIKYKDIVTFKYKGEFIDGEVFDEQEEVEFKVEELIAAWKEVMLMMNEGGEAFIVAPPQLAYGSHELDDIPPNSILLYRLKILGVK